MIRTLPGCSRDQKQPCPDDDGHDGSPDALTGRCETFDGDGCRHDSHHALVHDLDDQEYRRQAGTAVAAVEAEARLACPANGLVVVPQHWDQGRQHHRHHHYDLHAEERRRRAGSEEQRGEAVEGMLGRPLGSHTS